MHRVQWLERVAPAGMRSSFDGGQEPVLDATPGADPSRRAGYAAARASYRALLESEARGSWQHEVLVTVTVKAGRGGRGGRAVKAAGGGTAGACAVLLREVAALRRRLVDASIDVGAVFGPGEVASAVRASYAGPGAGDAPDALGETGNGHGNRKRNGHGNDVEPWPWPMGVAAEWSRVRVDGTWHATYWVAEWPRTDAGPDFLGPLLLSSSVRRTMSVVMEPLGPIEASRKVEQARTADIADAELRRRGGFLATARRRREEEILVRREVELADGHAQYRFAGYVTVSASGPDELEGACGQVEQAAGQAGLELRRCYGDQADTFLCALPLGRGLV